MARAQIIIKGMDFEVFACNIAKQIPKKRKLNKRKPNWWENFRHYIWKYWIESSLHFIFAIVLAPQSKGQDLVSVVFAMPSWLQTSMTWWWYCGLVEFKGNSLTRKIHFESDAPGVHRGREAEDDEKQETFENDIRNPAYTRCCRYFRCMRFKVGKTMEMFAARMMSPNTVLQYEVFHEPWMVLTAWCVVSVELTSHSQPMNHKVFHVNFNLKCRINSKQFSKCCFRSFCFVFIFAAW